MKTEYSSNLIERDSINETEEATITSYEQNDNENDAISQKLEDSYYLEPKKIIVKRFVLNK